MVPGVEVEVEVEVIYRIDKNTHCRNNTPYDYWLRHKYVTDSANMSAPAFPVSLRAESAIIQEYHSIFSRNRYKDHPWPLINLSHECETLCI
jgi:hypothetical protein